MNRTRNTLVALAALAALGAGGIADAKTKKIKPKAGAYFGKVTRGDAKGDEIRLLYATFGFDDGKDRKAVSLFQWTGRLSCEDGSTREQGGAVMAPLKGAKFSGTQKASGSKMTLKGKFTSNTKMTGTVRLVLDGATPAQQCDSGSVPFKAARHVE